MLCSRSFYLFAALKFDFHECLMSAEINKINTKDLIELSQEDYIKFINLVFDSKSKDRTDKKYFKELVLCFKAFAGAIIADCKFDFEIAKNEFLKNFQPLIQEKIKIIKKTPWFQYEKILKERRIKRTGI